MAKHLIMDYSGHSTIEFDPANTADLDAAVARFNALRKEGHTAATRKAGESDYTVIRDFKDTQDETIVTMPKAGG